MPVKQEFLGGNPYGAGAPLQNYNMGALGQPSMPAFNPNQPASQHALEHQKPLNTIPPLSGGPSSQFSPAEVDNSSAFEIITRIDTITSDFIDNSASLVGKLIQSKIELYSNKNRIEEEIDSFRDKVSRCDTNIQILT